MSVLEFVWTIFLYLLLGLGILAVSVIFTVILAATWVVSTRFFAEYKKAAELLEAEEAEQRQVSYYDA